VSLLFALAEPDVSAAVRRAHDAAVRQALGYLEREAGEVRRGTDGVDRLPGGGFVAAAFRHRTSRAGDPQLHTHVLVANMTQGADGRWSALDGRQLYAQAKTAGTLYQAVLRHELRDLGLAWTLRDNGLAELAGIPSAVLRAFSRRRVEIELALQAAGQSSRPAAEVAALATRKAKDYGVDPTSLAAEWHARADALGFDVAARAGLVTGERRPPPNPQQVVAVSQAMVAASGLTARRSAFTRREVAQAWCRALPDGGPVGVVETLADRLLGHPDVVPLDPAVPAIAAAARNARRYSTAELLAVEAELLSRALSGRHADLARVGDHELAAGLAAHAILSAEQAAMVRRLTTSGAGVEVVVGKAGSGKTTALAAAAAAWRAAGIEVTGAAVAARAAVALTDGAGIPAVTIARVLSHRGNPTRGLPAGGVLVVDEAGMLGTRALGRLLAAAEQTRTKVVLVGDHHQLPELEAGGAFRALAKQLDAVALTENRRQDAVWERAALDELRAGDVGSAVDAYRQAGRIHVADTAEQARRQLVDAWWQAAATRHGRLDPDVVMLALRRADVHELNLRARALLADHGGLTGPEIVVPVGDYGLRSFAAGDQVIARRNRYPLGLINGARGVVTAVSPEKGTVLVRFAGGEVAVSGDYLDDGGLDHGYALTVHQAQGLTADQAFAVAGDELYREAGYVAMSRARHGTTVYTAGQRSGTPEQENSHVPRPAIGEPPATLHRALTRSKAQRLAHSLAR
jgi:TrwC relaxase/AAA domain/UvrD-like helicase C-terminal domain